MEWNKGTPEESETGKKFIVKYKTEVIIATFYSIPMLNNGEYEDVAVWALNDKPVSVGPSEILGWQELPEEEEND